MTRVAQHELSHIGPPADVDYFSFDAARGIPYIIETTLGTLTDTVIELYRPGGVIRVAIDNNNGQGLASRLVWSPSVNGTVGLPGR